jgi:uncharacterized protein (DUF1330 family)
MRVSITRGGRRGIDLEIVRLRLSRRTRCDTLTPAHVCSAALNGVASAYFCRRMPRTAFIAENRNAFRKYGARFLIRGGKRKVVEGAGRTRIAVIEFKDYATALECYHSPEYAKAIEIRKSSAVADIIIADGYHGSQPIDG